MLRLPLWSLRHASVSVSDTWNAKSAAEE